MGWALLLGKQNGFFRVSLVALSEPGEFTTHEGISPNKKTSFVRLPAYLGTVWSSLAHLAAVNFVF